MEEEIISLANTTQLKEIAIIFLPYLTVAFLATHQMAFREKNDAFESENKEEIDSF